MKVRTTVELTANDVAEAIHLLLKNKSLIVKDQDFDVRFRFVKLNGQDELVASVEIV